MNADICPITVAIAAPTTPIAGIPNPPNMNMGSRTIFIIHPTI